MSFRILRRSIFIFVVSFTFSQFGFAQVPSWKASIVSVSSDSPALISSGENRQGKEPPIWPGRPAGNKWIVLTVEVTSPSKDATVRAADIKLIGKDGSYPVTAVGHQAKPKHAIVYLPLLVLDSPHPDSGMKEGGGTPGPGVWSSLYMWTADRKMERTSVGYFENSRSSKVLFRIILKGASGGRELAVAKSPLNIVLLFAVPESSSDLKLKFGDAEAVAIPGQ